MEINEIKRRTAIYSIGEIIASLSSFIIEKNVPGILAKVTKVEEDYNLLKQYYALGYEDSQRENVILSMRKRLYAIVFEVVRLMLIRDNRSFKSIYETLGPAGVDFQSVEHTLLGFDQELAIASISGEDKNSVLTIYKKQFEYRKLLFNRIVTSSLLNDDDMQTLENVLLSPMIDTIDRQIILNALLLALQINWDVSKFCILCIVYGKTEDRYLREHALFGIVSALPSETEELLFGEVYKPIFNAFIDNPETKKRLFELQRQLFITMDTEKTDQVIEKDIMPSLRSQAERLSAEMNNEDELSHILHPNLEEEGMEEIEKAVDKMRKLKSSGVDVFFGGFSKTKRYSFFYTLMNWFCPFYMEHPQLNTSQSATSPISTIQKLVTVQQMCNSDKYSFVLSLMSIMKNMPPQLSKMLMEADELPSVESISKDPTDVEIRQLYLQDMYRFYNLFPFKNDFTNYFADEDKVCFFNHSLFIPLFRDNERVYKIGQHLNKRKRMHALDTFIDNYDDGKSFEMKCLKALLAEHDGNYYLAYKLFGDCLAQQPDNDILIKKAANNAWFTGLYKEAGNLYALLFDGNTSIEERHHYAISMAKCLVYQEKVDEALSLLFQCYLEDADNVQIKSVIAWCYLHQDKPEEALRMFNDIDVNDLDLEGCWNKAKALLLTKKITPAVELLRVIVKKEPLDCSGLRNELLMAMQLLNQNRLKDEELDIIADLVFES